MPSLTINLLDVGQGDGIFVVFPNGQTMLVDLGTSKNKKVTWPSIKAYFEKHTKFANKGQTLDYLFVTHGDRDHHNMIRTFLKEFSVNVNFLAYGGAKTDYPKGFFDQISPDSVAVITPVKKLPVGFSIGEKDEEVQLVFLACNTPCTSLKDKGWRKNTASIVLTLSYGGKRVLLTGDATRDTEDAILENLRRGKNLALLESHVLKVQHHGSRRTSNGVKWLKAVNPECAFISSDRQGSNGDDVATGYRLPQALTCDLIYRHCGRLFKECNRHTVIVSYDEGDYNDYDRTPDVKNDYFNAGKSPPRYGVTDKNAWVSSETSDGIFTTLTNMDLTDDPKLGPYDQGAQYQITLPYKGQYTIAITDRMNVNKEDRKRDNDEDDQDPPDDAPDLSFPVDITFSNNNTIDDNNNNNSSSSGSYVPMDESGGA